MLSPSIKSGIIIAPLNICGMISSKGSFCYRNLKLRRNFYIVALFLFLAFPLASSAISTSTNYTIDADSTGAIHHSGTSSNYALEGSVESIVGSGFSNNYKIESGSSFQRYCGDGIIDPTEDCDGGDLNSQTCVSQGLPVGTLSCSASCTFNTTGCHSSGGGGISVILTAPIFEDTLPSFTYLSNFLFFGVKDTVSIYVYVNGSNTDVVYTTPSRWQKVVPLVLGSNTISIKSYAVGYGYSEEVQKIITRRLIGDINIDTQIDDYDLSLLANHWTRNWPESDFNGDGIVDDYDLSLMAAYWSK